MLGDPQHFSWRIACICWRELLLPLWLNCICSLFWTWKNVLTLTPEMSGFWEPGHQPATPGQCSPMKPVLEAYKSSQNAVIASTAQVDHIVSECARGLKTNSQWKYPSSGLNFHLAPVVLLCIQQGEHQWNTGVVTGTKSMASVLCSFPVCHPSTSSGCKANSDSRAGVPGGCSCYYASTEVLWCPLSLTTSFSYFQTKPLPAALTWFCSL